MVMKCVFCFYGPSATSRQAEFVVNGQSVCEDHVDNADGQEFSQSLRKVWED